MSGPEPRAQSNTRPESAPSGPGGLACGPAASGDGSIGSARRGMSAGTWLRVAASATLFGWLAYGVDWGELRAVVGNADGAWLWLALLLTGVLNLAGITKWHILLRSRGVAASPYQSAGYYLVGRFFGNFLPTNFGGDAVRAFLMGRRTGRYAAAAASVFVERAIGLSVLLALVPAALLLAPRGLGEGPVRATILVLAGLGAATVWAVLDPRLRTLIERKRRIPGVTKLLRFRDAVTEYRTQPGALAACLGLSLVFYALTVCNVLVALLVFNVHLDVPAVFVVTIVVMVVSSLPVAINGIGLAEWAYVFALAQFGVPVPAALSAALLIRAKTLGWSLVGGGIYALGCGEPRGRASAVAAAGTSASDE